MCEYNADCVCTRQRGHTYISRGWGCMHGMGWCVVVFLGREKEKDFGGSCPTKNTHNHGGEFIIKVSESDTHTYHLVLLSRHTWHVNHREVCGLDKLRFLVRRSLPPPVLLVRLVRLWLSNTSSCCCCGAPNSKSKGSCSFGCCCCCSSSFGCCMETRMCVLCFLYFPLLSLLSAAFVALWKLAGSCWGTKRTQEFNGEEDAAFPQNHTCLWCEMCVCKWCACEGERDG